MSRLRIDFAWRRPRRRRVVLAAVAGILLIAWGWLGWRYMALQSELDGWTSDRERLASRAAGKRTAGTAEERQRLQAELRLANRVIDALDRPWNDLFAAVDSAYSDQATLLAVEPDTERRVVRLTAEAKDLEAMVGFLKKVRTTPALGNATLTEHQINLQDAQRPVRFTILAAWSEVQPLAAANATASPSKPEEQQ